MRGILAFRSINEAGEEIEVATEHLGRSDIRPALRLLGRATLCFKLVTHALDDDVGRGVAAAFGAERLSSGRVLVANPRGLVIVSYPPDVEQKELLRDLKRLLTGAD